MLLYVLQNLIILAVCAFAYRAGNLAEKITGAWVAVNVLAYMGLMAALATSPTLSLVTDGVFSIGLLPIACVFATWGAGISATIMAASFAVQAYYMLEERPVDQLYLGLINWACLLVVLTLLISTASCVITRRRRPRQSKPAFPKVSAGHA